MFKKAGIVDEKGEAKPPKTLSEFVEDAKKLTDTSKKEYGFIYPVKDNLAYTIDINKWSMSLCGFPNGYNLREGSFDSTGVREIIKTFNTIEKAGCIMPGANGLTNDLARAKFAAGGVGMKTAGSYDFGVFKEQFPAKCEWGVVPFPESDGDAKYLSYMESSRYLYVNAQSKDKIGADKLNEVYKWFYSEELICDMYKNGLRIPMFNDIVEKTELPGDMEQWKEFAELAAVSKAVPRGVDTDLKNGRSFQTIWLESVCGAGISDSEIDALYSAAEKYYNDGIEYYYSQHTDRKASDFVYADWDAAKE